MKERKIKVFIIWALVLLSCHRVSKKENVITEGNTLDSLKINDSIYVYEETNHSDNFTIRYLKVNELSFGKRIVIYEGKIIIIAYYKDGRIKTEYRTVEVRDSLIERTYFYVDLPEKKESHKVGILVKRNGIIDTSLSNLYLVNDISPCCYDNDTSIALIFKRYRSQERLQILFYSADINYKAIDFYSDTIDINEDQYTVNLRIDQRVGSFEPEGSMIYVDANNKRRNQPFYFSTLSLRKRDQNPYVDRFFTDPNFNMDSLKYNTEHNWKREDLGDL